MASIRQQRAASQMQQILTELFLREINDPRLEGLTVTEVRVDREFQSADVYVNALGSDVREADVMEALKRASGFLRREVGGRTRFRSTPRLHFHWDPLPARAAQIDNILDSLDIPPEEEE